MTRSGTLEDLRNLSAPALSLVIMSTSTVDARIPRMAKLKGKKASGTSLGGVQADYLQADRVPRYCES
jgi:hypothetical protein